MLGCIAEVALIESDQRIGVTVDGGFEDHLVGWIASCGRHRNHGDTGSATAQSAEIIVPTSASLRPEIARCAGSLHTASYSSARVTVSISVNVRLRARSSNAAEAPVGLRSPATIILVSRTSRMISYKI